MALTIFTDIDCPVACDDVLLLPALPSDPDCTVVPPASRVTDLIMTPVGGTNPIDWTVSPVELVADTIDNTNDDNTLSRRLVGVGTIAAHEASTYETARFETVITKRRETLEFIVDVADQLIYDFLRNLQCGAAWKNWYFQYATYGEKIFGGETGMAPVAFDVTFPKESAAESVERATITVSWEFIVAPRRSDSPLVIQGVGGV